MIDKNMSKTELTHLAGISTNAMAKLGKNEDVRVGVLLFRTLNDASFFTLNDTKVA